MNNKGFTLAEVSIVVVITLMLTAIAVPNYMGVLEKEKALEGIRVLEALAESQAVYYVEFGSYTSTLSNLDVIIPTLQHFDAPTKPGGFDRVDIARSNGAYTLRIDITTKEITCVNGTMNCSKIGY